MQANVITQEYLNDLELIAKKFERQADQFNALLTDLKKAGVEVRYDVDKVKWNIKVCGYDPNATVSRKYSVEEIARHFRIPCPVASYDEFVRIHVDDLVKLIVRDNVPAPAKA